MRFRLVTKSGSGIGVAFVLMLEGFDVQIWIKEPEDRDVYKNFPMEQVKEWQAGLNKKNDVILFDMVGLGEIADKKRAEGFNVYDAGTIQDKIELDREYGLSIAEECGLFVPYSEEFTDFDAAIEAVQGDERLSVVTGSPIESWVIKPENNNGFVYVAKDKDDTTEMLKYFSTQAWKGEVKFILQEVVDGTEVSSECWFVNGACVPNSYNNTWETKRFMNDELGKQTGCQSSIVKFNGCPKLYEELFGKLNPWCLKNKLHGPLDLNCIISKENKKPYLLEHTSRFGYNAIYAWALGLNMKLGEFLSSCACGNMPIIEPSSEWLGAMRITIPPWPNDDAKEAIKKRKGWPISGIGRFDWNNIVPLDVNLNKDGKLEAAGQDCALLEIKDKDEDLSDLCKKMEKRADKLVIPDKQYRTDIYNNAQARIKDLIEYGYKVEW